ncbi:MAG TPA: DUF3347 domain-containing protein [Chryseolinea sp.]|nr:DUF3347 domain-containing protein [Chryseolinea sp.]HPH46036.1 DUF3347 domain-containing protein [Chryseolinea sp.]HPM31044.1 DUF3347 domain-containing protein [Chryseolinea sp.]
MKTKQVLQFAMSLALVVLIASCGGKKTETAKQDEHQHAASTETPSDTKIKAFENVDASVKTQINGLLENYFAVNKALIEDNHEVAKTEAKAFADNLAKFDMSKLVGEQMDFYHVQLAKISTGLKSIAESVDIEESRSELSNVSDGMYALVKAYHPNETELYYQFCPMAKNNEGAYWISETKEIVNPYMGQRMLMCGRTKEKL